MPSIKNPFVTNRLNGHKRCWIRETQKRTVRTLTIRHVSSELWLLQRKAKLADVKHYLDENKISEEGQYDGFYAVCTDLLDDEVDDILKVSEGRWQIEECFRIMKTDFSARPIYLQDENRIKAHFLICFLALTIYRFLEKKLGSKYTCEKLLDTLKGTNFAEIQEQGFTPLYKREAISQDLHDVCGFRTDYQFITKSKMRNIQKKSKGKE